MKILYAIQGTGNGHLSRAREIIPVMRRYAEVDLLVSGTQSEVALPWPLTYQYKGFSFCYNRKGGVSVIKSFRDNFTSQLIREIRSVPVEQYDLVVNDFEPVSAWAARNKGVPCVAMSHQAAYLSAKSPRPEKKDRFGEMVLKHYAPSQRAIGFHFEAYDDFIHTPVIRSEVRALTATQEGFFAVYLPAYRDPLLIRYLSEIPEAEWLIFSRYTKEAHRPAPNIRVVPVHNESFLQAMAQCQGMLTGGGFETPAEAMFLGKKVFAIPVKGQYEQQCNAAALAQMGCPTAPKLSLETVEKLKTWVESPQPNPVPFPYHTVEVVEQVLSLKDGLDKRRKSERTMAELSTYGN